MKVQLLLRAEHLPAPKGWMRKNPNTFAVVSTVSEIGTIMGIKRRRVGVTEVVPSTFSPEWATVIVVDLPISRGTRTDLPIAVDIFHTNSTDAPKFKSSEKHDRRYQEEEHRGLPIPTGAESITSMIFSMAQVFYDTPDWTLEQKIPGSAAGKIVLHVETSKEQHDYDDCTFFFQLYGFSLPNTRRNFLERPAFYFVILRKFQETWRLVYRSSLGKGSNNPLWPEGNILIEWLCNHDLNRDLLIRVIDIEGNIHKEVGSFQTTVHGLMGAVSKNEDTDIIKSFSIMNGEKRVGAMVVRKASVITPGSFVQDATFRMESSTPMAIAELVIQDASEMKQVKILNPPGSRERRLSSFATTFQDYARHCPIEWCIGIDFSAANGDFRLSNSAHYRTTERVNDYEWTMTVLGETLRDFNRSHEYPVWGFGGDFHGKTQSIFQCGPAPKAQGISGLLQAYATTFTSGMTLGKTCSTEKILQTAANHAQKQLEHARNQRGGSLSFTILSILMVGSESDVLAVKEKLIGISGAPLSVLFINMPRGGRLEDCKLRLYFESSSIGRFNNCTILSDAGQAISQRDGSALSRMVLNVLNDQVPAYFQSQGMSPPMT